MSVTRSEEKKSSHQPFNDNEIIKRILDKKHLKVVVSSIKGKEERTIEQLIALGARHDKSVIFTVTPGPFKDNEMPEGWMETEPAIGCRAQLSAFNNAFSELNAYVYAINKHTPEYQCGGEGLIKKRKIDNLCMISDANNTLEKEWHMNSFSLNVKENKDSKETKETPKKYLDRFTVVFKPDGKAQLFTLRSLKAPENEKESDEHIKKIREFIGPQLKVEEKAEVVPAICQRPLGMGFLGEQVKNEGVNVENTEVKPAICQRPPGMRM